MTATATAPARKPRARQRSHEALLRGTHWAITRDALDTIIEIASRRNGTPEAIAAELGRPLQNTRTAEERDGIARIPVCGPLFRYANLFTECSGATSYETLATDFATAIESPEVRAIVLDVDSPGGTVNGCGELAELIFAARGKKPIVAHVSGLGCSAAYWLASAADRVVAAPTAILGSIGACMSVEDTSERDKMNGIKRFEIISSQSPKKNLDPAEGEGRSEAQRMVDELGALFVGAVAKHRAVSAEHVIEHYGQGGVLVGSAAVAAGLVDGLATYEELHRELLGAERATGRSIAAAHERARTTPPTRTPDMNDKTTPRAEAAFESGAKVRSTVSRDVVIDEGAEGEIAEVREGYFYAIDFGNGTYRYLAEDEVEIAGAANEEEEAEPDPAREEEEPEARTVAQIRLAAASAERQRILTIQALARPGQEQLARQAVDEGISAEAAAVRFLNAQRDVGSQRIRSLEADDKSLDKPGPVAPEAVDDTSPRAAARQILAVHARVTTPTRSKA